MTHDERSNDGPGLGPPRFRLATMLSVVAGLCIVLASFTWFGASGALLFGLFALAVLAHVTGNWLGNQLRDIGNQSHDLPSEAPFAEGLPAEGLPLKYRVQEHHFAPSTSLRQHRQFSRAAKVAVLVGATMFGLSGGAVLALMHWSHTTWASVGLAALALAVLAAIGLFVVLGFIQAGWHALSEASRHR